VTVGATRRATLEEAADILGVSKEAVRKRVIRGTLRSDIGADRRRYVCLYDGGDEPPTPERDALISEMQERLAFLERELEVRSEEIRRRDTIIMNMTEAIKALNPPAPEDSSGARESPESSGPAGGLGEVQEELLTERARREMAESTLHEGMDEERRRREEAEQERDDLRRELHALREGPEAAETPEEQQGRGHAAGVAQEGVQRSWWRRMFRG
jgi:hypothetical protein